MGRPRKDGERYPNGRIKRAKSPPTSLGHRSILAEGLEDPDHPGMPVDPKDQRLGYPLGVLYLQRKLTKAQHDIAVEFGNLHAAYYGRGSVRSHLQSFAGATTRGQMDEDERERKRAKLSDTLDHLPRRPRDVLLNLAVYERPLRFMDTTRARSEAARKADERDCEALIEATRVLAKHWGFDRSAEPASARRNHPNGVDREILIKGLARFSSDEQAQILSAAKAEHRRSRRDVIQIVKRSCCPILALARRHR